MTSPQSDALPSRLRVPARQRPVVELVAEGFRELLGRRRLIRYMVAANLKRTHADTALGQLWWVLDPLLQMGIYVVLVELIFQRGTPDYPLFVFAAILPWKWLSISLGQGASSITAREGLIRQVQFPKIVLPAAAVVAGTFSFAISLVALALMYSFFVDRVSPWLLLIPVIAAVQLVFSLALAIGLAAMNTFYRDIHNLLRHVLRLWFYASPGLWSFQNHLQDPSPLRTLLMLNPMAPVLESYRSVIYGTADGAHAAPDWTGLLLTLGVSVVLLIGAVALFKRLEPSFAKVVQR